MNTLFDLDSIPEAAPAPKSRTLPHYYIRAKYTDGTWYFLWQSHDNGGGDWRPETELTVNGGKKKPLRYRTRLGAKKALIYHLDSDVQGQVAEWKGE